MLVTLDAQGFVGLVHYTKQVPKVYPHSHITSLFSHYLHLHDVVTAYWLWCSRMLFGGPRVRLMFTLFSQCCPQALPHMNSHYQLNGGLGNAEEVGHCMLPCIRDQILELVNESLLVAVL